MKKKKKRKDWNFTYPKRETQDSHPDQIRQRICEDEWQKFQFMKQRLSSRTPEQK